MITEDYVSFETAKLLKEKGFDELTPLSYSLPYGYESNIPCSNSIDTDFVSRITIQMAMKWLREKYHLEIYPFHDAIQECNTWWYRVERHTQGCGLTEHESDSIYGKYEDACEDAIKYCLENLI